MKKDIPRTIIVKRRAKGGHGGHHGGGWKVAYADFVTAMMAFFMVMWILGMDENTRKAVEGYFANPIGYRKGYGSGQSPVATGQTPVKLEEAKIRAILHSGEEKAYKDAAERIKSSLEAEKGLLGSATFSVTVGSQGLRIELIEDDSSGENLFPRGSAAVTAEAKSGLDIIARELTRLHSSIVIEGHTDSAPYGAPQGYTNWELSADRANAARRVLVTAGLAPGRISEVRGYADTRLRRPDLPLAGENRRISLLIPFSQPVPDTDGGFVTSTAALSASPTP